MATLTVEVPETLAVTPVYMDPERSLALLDELGSAFLGLHRALQAATEGAGDARERLAAAAAVYDKARREITQFLVGKLAEDFGW
jgi:hypothetical protein